ncbi:hypothetical protein FA13DRAFT_1731356 [Coprinellus micaceus]|uniref:Nephrocystin 3-like N-terminal domain-containing protein n=1 Tax=Coprinellus micaceus TaxID=71717 RepID=A0A4Y7TFT6_COPMI|nr:hypothetical protein FA13DRAFT_1731356 [Coprinellus micaceus]
MNSSFAQPSSGPLNAFAGAQGVRVHELNFTQAQNVHHYNYARPLDLFQLLNPLPDASHTRDRRTSPPDSQCLAGTRQDVCAQLDGWVRHGTITQDPTDHQDEGQVVKPICWMFGSFGCGKSAIAQTMAEWHAEKGRLAASFFFFRGAGRRSTVDGFATTLAHQIALNVPGARKFIEEAIIQDPHVGHSSRSLHSQVQSLIYTPLLRCIEEGNFPREDPYLLVIDGMDECDDKEAISSFIDDSVKFFSAPPYIPLRLFIASRVEEHIRTHIEDGTAVIHLFDLSSRSNRADVEYAMKFTFANARKHDRALQALGYIWPTQDDMDILVNYCDGSYIFMSTIARFILWGSGNDDPRTPKERLSLALEINPGIDSVYRDVLSRSRDLPHFFTIVSTMAHLKTPLSISAIAALLGLPTYHLTRVLVTLQAILQVPGWDDEPVTFFHTSLRDFLTDEARSGVFYSPSSHHTYLMHCCFDVLVGAEPSGNPEACKYAINYWREHLEVADHFDATFNLQDLLQSERPYNPIDQGEWGKCSFQSRRGEWGPIKFAVTYSELLMANTPFSSYLLPSLYDEDSHRWSMRWGIGGDLISLKCLHVCSLRDIAQGLTALTENPWGGSNFGLTLRRGNGVDVVMRRQYDSLKEEWQFTFEDRR